MLRFSAPDGTQHDLQLPLIHPWQLLPCSALPSCLGQVRVQVSCPKTPPHVDIRNHWSIIGRFALPTEPQQKYSTFTLYPKGLNMVEFLYSQYKIPTFYGLLEFSLSENFSEKIRYGRTLFKGFAPSATSVWICHLPKHNVKKGAVHLLVCPAKNIDSNFNVYK